MPNFQHTPRMEHDGVKLAIMQPYFFPYIGYFQLIAAVDRFVLYDNIKYTKKGWINRNRFLLNGYPETFSLPLRSASDQCQVVEREISADFSPDTLMARLHGAYRKAPYFVETRNLLESALYAPERGLFDYLLHAVKQVCAHLEIDTELVVSSTLPIDHTLSSQDKVIALCEACTATTYINPIGGTELYEGSVFEQHGIKLRFLRSSPLFYSQFSNHFVPSLSILDVLMFNPRPTVREWIANHYELI